MYVTPINAKRGCEFGKKAERERMGREGREGENYVIIIAKNIVEKEIIFNL